MKVPVIVLLCTTLLYAFDWSGGSVKLSNGQLKVSENGRYIVHSNGTPFFYLGCTAWELFHRMNRENVETYLENRRERGYTVIMVVGLAELNGLTVANPYGDKPLINNDPTRPDVTPGNNFSNATEYDYWDHVEWVIDKVAEKGMYVGFLPTWGDKVTLSWGPGPQIFNSSNAATYGTWIANRFKGKQNIIWVMGGDRDATGYEAVWNAMAQAIKTVMPNHLMSYHPLGGMTSSRWFHNSSWLNFNMCQSGHRYFDQDNYNMVASDYAKTPVKPCMEAEPNYEDHPLQSDNTQRFRDYSVRKAAYWGVFAGGHGHIYGHHSIWGFHGTGYPNYGSTDRTWSDAITRPGGQHMAYLRKLMESRPFLSRIPDQTLIASGGGGSTRGSSDHVQATRSSDGSYAMIYIPKKGQTVTIRMDRISGSAVKAWWFDPRTGGATAIDGTFSNSGTRAFTTPATADDWVLVLDDSTKEFPVPGSASLIAPDPKTAVFPASAGANAFFSVLPVANGLRIRSADDGFVTIQDVQGRVIQKNTISRGESFVSFQRFSSNLFIISVSSQNGRKGVFTVKASGNRITMTKCK